MKIKRPALKALVRLFYINRESLFSLTRIARILCFDLYTQPPGFLSLIDNDFRTDEVGEFCVLHLVNGAWEP